MTKVNNDDIWLWKIIWGCSRRCSDRTWSPHRLIWRRRACVSCRLLFYNSEEKVPLRCHCDVVASSVSKAKLGNFWHILRNSTILTFLKYKCYIWSQIIWLVNVLSDNALSISDNFLFHETSSTELKCRCSMRVLGYWILGV